MKTLGAYETFSFSYLGASSYSKSKAKAEKDLKSSFKTRSKLSDSSYSSSSTLSRNMSLMSTSLVNGDKFLIFSNSSVWILIAALLLYLSALKLLHREIDKGKQDLQTFISNQLSLRNILLCFYLHDFKLSVACDPPHICSFSRIKFAKTCFTPQLQVRIIETAINRRFGHQENCARKPGKQF